MIILGSYITNDTDAMQRAFALARRGSGMVSPNPMVGAVIVKEQKIVGYGWHKGVGQDHAEVEAMRMAGENTQGATLYITLEPCNHHGHTPPCADTIIKAGIKRVVIPMLDPNPHVLGGGAEKLREADLEVDVGLMEGEAREINATWLFSMFNKRPFVVLKLALSLDGKIAYADGSSKWLSSSVARAQIQRLRRHMDAVMVGSNTIKTDNSMLTNRTGHGRQPLRVIVDSKLKTDISSKVYSSHPTYKSRFASNVVVMTTAQHNPTRRKQLEDIGVKVEIFDETSDGQVNLSRVLSSLYNKGVQGIICEGGAQLGTSLLCKGLCDRLMLYHTPRFIGADGISFLQIPGAKLRDSETCSIPLVELYHTRKVGPDVLTVYKTFSQ